MVNTPRVVSFVTRKGGVGKTTLTFTIGEFLARELSKNYRVLVIDLDPQSSASTSMVGDDRWKEADDKGQTIHQMFYDALHKKNVFDIEKAIIKNASNLHSPNLHLLPSSIKLEDIKQDLKDIGADDRFRATTPAGVLSKHIRRIKDNYDYILLDCPPDMGIPTLNGLAISDGYVIPSIPDYISTYGIPMVMKYIREFSEALGREIRPYGIIFNKKRPIQLHDTIMSIQKAKQGNPPIFDTIVDERARLSEAADYESRPSTTKQKYGSSNETYDTLVKLAKEFIVKVGDPLNNETEENIINAEQTV